MKMEPGDHAYPALVLACVTGYLLASTGARLILKSSG